MCTVTLCVLPLAVHTHAAPHGAGYPESLEILFGFRDFGVFSFRLSYVDTFDIRPSTLPCGLCLYFLVSTDIEVSNILVTTIHNSAAHTAHTSLRLTRRPTHADRGLWTRRSLRPRAETHSALPPTHYFLALSRSYTVGVAVAQGLVCRWRRTSRAPLAARSERVPVSAPFSIQVSATHDTRPFLRRRSPATRSLSRVGGAIGEEGGHGGQRLWLGLAAHGVDSVRERGLQLVRRQILPGGRA